MEPTIFRSFLFATEIPEHHFNVYVFFASTGLDIAYLIVFLFEGCIAAIVAQGKRDGGRDDAEFDLCCALWHRCR